MEEEKCVQILNLEKNSSRHTDDLTVPSESVGSLGKINQKVQFKTDQNLLKEEVINYLDPSDSSSNQTG